MRRLVTLTLALGLTGWAVTPATAQPKDIVIGISYPMTGPNAQAGIDNKPAFEIAAEIANGSIDFPAPFYQRLKGMPGLKGARVRLIFSDHQTKPELGQAEAERLITQEKVHALVCCWASSVTAVASQVAERYGIPFLNADSSSPGLTRRGLKFFFRTTPHDEHFTQAMFDFFRDFEKKRGVKVKTLALTYEDTLFIVMRVYFEKPRTTVGWKGLINDPHMDDSFRIEEGLQMARGLLLELAEMGVPAGTEALDPISPQYFSDLVSWYAIGARTTESQTHREMASGLSAPVGFKNNTDGSLNVAINAMLSVSNPHRFLGINHDGQCAIIRTKGNRYGHVVLRGGGGKPNYDSVTVALCEKALATKKVSTNLVIDCSHDNANKDPGRQPLVLNDGAHQILEGNQSLVGFMLESNIHWGKQPIPADVSQLQYGVSVTDGCIDWATTDKVLLEARDKLKDVLPTRL